MSRKNKPRTVFLITKYWTYFTGMLLILILNNPATFSQDIYFDDSGPDLIKVGNTSYYEAGFRKTNGSFAYIIDKATNQQVCKGSRWEILWGTYTPDGNPGYIGSSLYSNTSDNLFTYNWDDGSKTLQLVYTPDDTATDKITATVTVTFSNGNYFDLQMEMQNERPVGIELVIFPSGMVFLENEIADALLPVMPGMLLKSSFFTEARSYSARYPGWPGVFSDFLSIRAGSGQFAMYGLTTEETEIPIVDLGFVHDDDYLPVSTYLKHDYITFVSPGSTWESTPVRIRIGETHMQSVADLRSDNQIQQLLSLREKTGSRFEALSQSPMLKVGIKGVGGSQGFSNYRDFEALLPDLPSPSVFHLVEYNPGAFDHNYPDFIPPDPNYGTLDDFADLFNAARQYGLLVMPYANPTWWDDNSPTVLNQLPPLTINDIAVLDKNGNPRWETYNGNAGFIVSPCSPFVQSRLSELMDQLTVGLPSDLVFEDQIGARGGITDFNPATPSPGSYFRGWLDYTLQNKEKLLATEMGYDKLLESEVAFCGSALLPWRVDANFINAIGEGNMEFFPFTALVARDKVLFFQHNLAPETATTDLKTLTHNIAMGFNLTYDLASGLTGFPEWLKVCGDFQKYVLSAYTDELMQAVSELQADVYQYNYNTVTATVNGDGSSGFQYGDNVLSPNGFYIESDDGNLQAGVLRAYNGNNLGSGDHYLIVSRLSQDSILVDQPLGTDTEISVTRPADWPADSLISVDAMYADGNTASVNYSLNGSKIIFNLSAKISGEDVDHYLVIYKRFLSVNENNPAAKGYLLFDNYPNPFYNSTTIAFSLLKKCKVYLDVYNLTGEKVATLTNGDMNAGYHEVVLNENNLAGGIYFYRIQAGSFVKTKKLIHLK